MYKTDPKSNKFIKESKVIKKIKTQTGGGNIDLVASETLPCGAFGCFLNKDAFMKLVNKIENLNVCKMEKISFKEVNGKIDPVYIKSKNVLDTLEKFEIPDDTSFKLIYNYKKGTKALNEELTAAAKLYSIIGPGGINQYTTFRIIKKDPLRKSKDKTQVIGFKFIFDKEIVISKKGKGNKGDFHTKEIGIIINQTCISDLEKMSGIDFDKFLSDIVPVINTYLEEGYVHKDIKPENMVACKTKEGLKYKLIDWGLMLNLNDTHNPIVFSGTPAFISPAIVYYSSENNAKFFRLPNNKERILFRQEYLDEFMNQIKTLSLNMPKTHPDITKLVKKSVKSFEKMLKNFDIQRNAFTEDEINLKYKLAKHGDLYALGLSIFMMAENGQFVINKKVVGSEHPKIKNTIKEMMTFDDIL